MKKIVSFLLTITIILTLSISVTAEYNLNSSNLNYIENKIKLILIDEYEYYDEDGNFIVDRLYTSNTNFTYNKSNNIDNSRTISNILASSGSSYYSHEKEITFTDTSNVMKYRVGGYFTFNSSNNTATVTSEYYSYDSFPGITIKKENFSSGSNQGGLFLGKVYAYVKNSFTISNIIGWERSFSIYLDVNKDGEIVRS